MHYFIDNRTALALEDNDLRISLQLAAAYSNLKIVKYLLSLCANSANFRVLPEWPLLNPHGDARSILQTTALLDTCREKRQPFSLQIVQDIARVQNPYVPLLISPVLSAFIRKQLMPKKKRGVDAHLLENAKQAALNALVRTFFKNADKKMYSIDSIDRCAQELKIFLKRANCSPNGRGNCGCPKLSKRLAQKKSLGVNLEKKHLTDVSFAWSDQ